MRAPFSGVLTGPVPQAPPQPSALGRNFGVTLALAILLGLAARVIELRPLELLRDIGNIGLFVKGYLHPSFTHIGVYAWQCVVTVCIALWGTLLAVVIAVPLGLCGARNLSPHPVVYFAARRVMDVLRAVNEFVFALMFVTAVGLGPFAGMLALGIHTGGVLGKLLSETIESIDPGQIEGVAAVGAGPLSVISFGVAPQVMPNFLSYILLRFESDVRSASVIGMVGGGGIGFYLWDRDPAKLFSKITFSGSHEASILAVANKKVDVASTNLPDLQQLTRENKIPRGALRVIWVSKLIPNDPIVVRKDMPPSLRSAIQESLTTMKARRPEAFKEIGAWVGGFVPADDSKYQVVRELDDVAKKLAAAKK